MRWLTLLITVIIILTGCWSYLPPRSSPTIVQVGQPSPTPPSAAIPSSIIASPQAVDVRWEASPAARVIRYYSPYTTAGLAGAYDHTYYIPEAQVWGDGRIIWVRYEGSERRRADLASV